MEHTINNTRGCIRYRTISAFFTVIAVLCIVTVAHADTSIALATVTAQISSAASLSLGVNSITFPSANPSTTLSVPANENGLTVGVNARTGASGSVLLSVLATGDLTSGVNTIPIGNVTWTCTGTGFQAGTFSKTAAQTVGSWTGSGTHSASMNYFLANSFSYVTGTYTATLTYTLLAP